MALIKVKFYGTLKQFGTEFNLDCQSVAEALKALTGQLKGLRQAMQQGRYKVRIGSQYLDNRYLEKGLHYRLKDGMTVHFTPVVAGAKSGGVFNIVAGVALVAASWYAGGAAGWAYLGASGYGMATMAFTLGASMILSGVSQMLTKTPSMGSFGEEKEKKSSTGFNSLQNRVAQGQAIPLAYGRIMTGSLIISQGVETFDAETAKEDEKQGRAFFGLKRKRN